MPFGNLLSLTSLTYLSKNRVDINLLFTFIYSLCNFIHMDSPKEEDHPLGYKFPRQVKVISKKINLPVEELIKLLKCSR